MAIYLLKLFSSILPLLLLHSGSTHALLQPGIARTTKSSVPDLQSVQSPAPAPLTPSAGPASRSVSVPGANPVSLSAGWFPKQ
ncbi:hypothetical protein FCM35_KLT10419 [Carex littledalei]|uniref:Uncharacterized protein n=1 Tax=Carex littledalei TaxID=544730 RepID=A0A833VJE9_9POAL|nr:hypothetical protein FCM35_KLT10419 [Carex littledalei]